MGMISTAPLVHAEHEEATEYHSLDNVYYEEMIVTDIEEIYSSYYEKNIYRVFLYDEAYSSVSQINVTPEMYTYNWIYRVYLDRFQDQGYVDINTDLSYYNYADQYYYNHDVHHRHGSYYYKTHPNVRYKFNSLIHKFHKKKVKKRKSFKSAKRHHASSKSAKRHHASSKREKVHRAPASKARRDPTSTNPEYTKKKKDFKFKSSHGRKGKRATGSRKHRRKRSRRR